MTRRLGSCLLALLITLAGREVSAYLDSPSLEPRIASGELPPVDERVPAIPLVVDLAALGRAPGKYGDELRLLMGDSKDTRLMVVYGYARLVGYSESLELLPDILQAVEVEEDRRFTLHLRPGHKWSDGHPFTVEDFRYFWEDIINDAELSRYGIPQALLVDEEPPLVEFIDEMTIRYTWSKPNPFFLPGLAATQPLEIFVPAHYLRQFHARYADAADLQQKVEAEGQEDWVALHTNQNRSYKNNNLDLPSLQPWILTEAGPSQRFVFERNPYFHRIDENGRQLPYIDRVVMDIVDGKLIPAKTGAGETDLQARHLKFSDYTFLKHGEERSGYDVRLWQTTKGSHVALYPNLNVSDPVWRALVRDVRFRRALSLAINRHELNQVLYYGLAVEGNNSVYESCSFFRPEYRSAWAEFDPDAADRLLDEMGLTERDSRGVRRLPDGRPMEIIVETAGEDTEQVDVLQLVHDGWMRVGIKLFAKPLQREVFRNRIFAGSTLMAVWGGMENGLPTPSNSPQELAPTSQQQYQWPKWGQYFETKGETGEPPDMPQAIELLELNEAWRYAGGEHERRVVWERMLDIYIQQVFSIGLIAGVKQPVVVSRRLRNVPEQGIYNWEPGAHFGIYRPDTFWLEDTP